jgi:excinuclease ABC subunit C
VMQSAMENASIALRRHLDRKTSGRVLLEQLVERFDLSRLPQRIEVYDNSHISGTDAIGAMIVAGAEGFQKAHYRKFTIKQAAGNDDFAMMREVLRRRLKRVSGRSSVVSRQEELTIKNLVLNDNPERTDDRQLTTDDSQWPTPDLILIDGGAGQLSAALEVLREFGLEDRIDLISIAKGPERNAGRERFFQPGKPDFQLPFDDPLLHYLQRLRDEAHRFAISTHRAKRSSSIKKSELDTIEGIGAVRKKALLHFFGSAKAVSNASREDIMQVRGINAATADLIWRHFHGS